jgi:hypothetical protein
MKMRDSSLNRVLMALCLALLFLAFATSCATSTLSEGETPSSEAQPVQESVQPVTVFYYDFKDVPVPKEMEIKRDKSFVFQTTEFTAGLLAFSGRVELDSLMQRSSLHQASRASSLIVSWLSREIPSLEGRIPSGRISPRITGIYLRKGQLLQRVSCAGTWEEDEQAITAVCDNRYFRKI